MAVQALTARNEDGTRQEDTGPRGWSLLGVGERDRGKRQGTRKGTIKLFTCFTGPHQPTRLVQAHPLLGRSDRLDLASLAQSSGQSHDPRPRRHVRDRHRLQVSPCRRSQWCCR